MKISFIGNSPLKDESFPVLHVVPNRTDKAGTQVAVAFSGGMDSTLAILHLLFVGVLPVPYYVEYGSPYEQKELQAIQLVWHKIRDMHRIGCFSPGIENHELPLDVKRIKAELCREDLAGVPTPEKQEVYGRNLLIAYYGTLISPKVVLGVLATDMTAPDKSLAFFQQTQELLGGVMVNNRWRSTVEWFDKQALKVEVVPAFSDLTKSQAIDLVMRQAAMRPRPLTRMGQQKQPASERVASLLKMTTSCYSAVEKGPCGTCSTCFKRWVAETNNRHHGVVVSNYAAKPYESDYAKEIIRLAKEAVLWGQSTPRMSHVRALETLSSVSAVEE